MFNKSALLICVLLAKIGSMLCSSYPPIHHNWTRSEKMDPNGILQLQWHLRDKEIVFRVTVNSRGFVAIGFLYPNPKISGFDMALAWVHDRTGKANILDCHGKNTNFEDILKDDTQNYIIENEGYQNLTHTVIVFKRSLETCDPRDVPFTQDTLKMFWGYGERDIVSTQLDKIKFKAKGIRAIHLLNPSFKMPADNADVKHWDATVKNVTIHENDDTIYWCKIFKGPDLMQKHHIIGFEPILTKDILTKKSTVHHMTLFECTERVFEKNTDDLEVWTKSKGVVCNSNDSNIFSAYNWDSCITPVASWGIGGSAQYLPDHVGIPFSGKQKYYMLEIHYDNFQPTRKTFEDNSGLRIHYTSKLRQHDGGIMINGVTTSSTQLIPPRQKSFRNIGICGQSCTSKQLNVFPDEGINIVSVSFQTHSAGRKFKFSHIRNGTELEKIVEDDSYNYKYQEVRQLTNETKVLPDDYLIIECEYDTQSRNWPTLGGYSTKEEMCLAFITYYPKIDLVGCYSMIPVQEFFSYFGVKGFYGVDMTDVENMILYGEEIVNRPLPSVKDIVLPSELKVPNDEFHDLYKNSLLNKLVINDPVEFHDRTFMSHLYQLPLDDASYTSQLEFLMTSGRYMLFCRISNDSIRAPTEIINYPEYVKKEKEIDKTCPYHIYLELLANAATIKAAKMELLFGLLIILHISRKKSTVL